MKICVFGGTFDPLHLGHENIIKNLLSRFDKVIIVPSKQSPNKEMPLTDGNYRLAMLSLCNFITNPNLIIDDYELRSSDQPSFTIHLIKHVKNKFKKSDIYLALGLDQLNDLHNWHESEKLLTMIKIICFNRNRLANEQVSIKYEFIENFNYNISSSEIRSFIQTDYRKAKDMLNKNIFNYIIKEKLYK